jgi:hypothetical protein
MHNRQRRPVEQPLLPAYVTLHQTDPITGNEEMLFTLFYEYYRGYTIYSTEDGRCSIHGRDGCLRIQGMYACFPDIEQAKRLIKHFQADGRTAQESMCRYVPAEGYVCVNRAQLKHAYDPQQKSALRAALPRSG